MSAVNEWDVELNTRRQIPYLQATMYYFVYHIKSALALTLTVENALNHGVYIKSVSVKYQTMRSRVDHAKCDPWKDENWYREIPLLSFINPPLRLCQIREHVRKTYLLKKLLSGVSDSCINTSPRLVRKYPRIFFRRHYEAIFRLYPNSYCIFKLCKEITFFFLTMQQRKQINF